MYLLAAPPTEDAIFFVGINTDPAGGFLDSHTHRVKVNSKRRCGKERYLGVSNSDSDESESCPCGVRVGVVVALWWTGGEGPDQTLCVTTRRCLVHIYIAISLSLP